ncbi:hypothetical protein [Saccharopolyspora phatthalungensis]|uniref:Uncharacterized protein n=1 Tax=Saccharopolyspora phatthalungensis TaxID=664693 RepID=A0A840PZ15_9PSEU|nr:hypothetical protein [Saccharopolyspora phatthalungensis]MBB5152990.1 hypothetical protein [Saccharopolyspora phatthalungensis]
MDLRVRTRPGLGTTTSRRNKLTPKLREHGLGAVADLGFTGLEDDPDDPVITPAAARPAAARSPTPRSRPTSSSPGNAPPANTVSPT